MLFTYYGQSCFGIVVNGAKLLFDPFITPNEKAKHININEIEADYILISHGHGDHVADVEAIAKRTGATLVSSFEITNWFESKGCIRYQPMNTGGKWKFEFGTVKCVNAIHSSTMPDGASGGNPMGFVITSDDGNFYYSGDTALTLDMQLIPSYASLDFCILPVGDNFTMGYEDAAEAAIMVGCKTVIGVHFDTFGFITIDHQKAKDYFKMKGLELILLSIGESIDI
ncbi:MAG: metal-dependent hydrolase [Ferruginibacter sp.]|nr:metal-dependent hydrolase [Ferruginibacter sp.]